MKNLERRFPGSAWGLGIFFWLLLCCPAWGSAFVTFPSSWDVGQAFALSLSSAVEYRNPSVTWLGRTVSLDVEQGGEGYVSYGLLGSYVRDIKPGEYPLVFEFIQNGQRIRVTGTVRLVARKYPEEHLKVSPKMVFPSKVDQPRIKREAALAAAAKRTMTVKRFWSTPPQYPIRSVVTSSYGFRRVYNGTPRSPHAGTDFRAAVGTPVAAPFSGTVVLTGDHYYAGKSIYVDSGNGVLSVFFHLSEIGVKKGDRVKKGQIVGKSGATGRITGPHLHYGLCLAGQYVDPFPLFSTNIAAMLNGMEREEIDTD